MLGKIININEDIVKVYLDIDIYSQASLMGVNIIFEDNSAKILGEIITLDDSYMTARLLGYIENNKFYKTIKHPSFRSKIRVVSLNELSSFLGPRELGKKNLYLGTSPIYKNYPVSIDLSKFFLGNFLIKGKKGSGKTLMLKNIVTNTFKSSNYVPLNAKIMLLSHRNFNEAFDSFADISFALNYRNISLSTYKVPFNLVNAKDLKYLINIDKDHEYLIDMALNLASDDMALKNKELASLIKRVLKLDLSSFAKKAMVIEILSSINTKLLSLDTFIKTDKDNQTLLNIINKNLFDHYFIDYLDIFDNNTRLNSHYKYKDFSKALYMLYKINKEEHLYNELNMDNISEYFNEDNLSKENYIANLFKFDKRYQVVNINIKNIYEERLVKILLSWMPLNKDEIYNVLIDDIENFKEIYKYVDIDIKRENNVYYGLTTSNMLNLSQRMRLSIASYIILDDNIYNYNHRLVNEKIELVSENIALVFGSAIKIPTLFNKINEYQRDSLDRYWYQ